ncbi:alpha/beta hydrolase [Hassallia byssoidea VB512170]|uniref:Alpha/beta hydrolase n=1 Tax=Hassallia byssoidea VB512170 TaxID=1304833 RepID=A0A846HC85_9CYAN|nr:alpha/beta hydrolase [Hassalia byssoidea]NEU74985.1 alpha/beta hydrolase [Hassalia byssoidea VB512170]
MGNGRNAHHYYQLPILNYQLPITNSQLPITNYQFPTTAAASVVLLA